MTPSSFSDQSWVICSQAILDAAALYIAAIEEDSASAPHVCLAVGTSAVRDVSASIGFQPNLPPDPPAGPTEAQFTAGLALLRAAHVPVNRDTVETWARFAAMNSAYAPPLRYIAQYTLTRGYLGFPQVDS